MILWILGGTVIVMILVFFGVIAHRVFEEMKEQHLEGDDLPTIESINNTNSIESSYFIKPDVQKCLEFNQNILDGKENN